MTGAQLGLGILVGVIALILLVSVVTVMITKLNSKELNGIHNMYLNGIDSSDDSIRYVQEKINRKGDNNL